MLRSGARARGLRPRTRGKGQEVTMEHDVVLPTPPKGFCAQVSLLRPGSNAANAILKAITTAGGRVVALRPLFLQQQGSWRVLAIYYLPLEQSGLVPGDE